jgi:hypothetical protein
MFLKALASLSSEIYLFWGVDYDMHRRAIYLSFVASFKIENGSARNLFYNQRNKGVPLHLSN